MMCSFLFFLLHPLFFSFRERFPTSRCHTYGVIPVCKKDPSASLGMTIWGKRPSKHVRCTKRRISIPLLLGYAPRPVISSAARNLPCTPSFLASFASGFPFSAISHRAIYRYARKIEGYARDDGTRITICKHFTAGFSLFCCLT